MSKKPKLSLIEAGMSKEKALEAALTQIERTFGKGSIMRLGEAGKVADVDVVSTGSIGLDMALGIGGLPRGRVIEIYGPESSGKTTLTLHVLAEAQKDAGLCAFIDAEHALDPIYARKLGVDVDELLISQPDTGEQALEIADTLVRSGAIEVLVIDSVAALTPKAELEGEMGDSLPGLHARLMSQALRKLTGTIARSNCLVIFINQTRVKVVKNKMAPPFRQTEFEILYGEGISRTGELIDLADDAGVIDKAGSWYSFDSQRLGQGRENVRTFLKENVEVANRIEAALRQAAGLDVGRYSETGSPVRLDADGKADEPAAPDSDGSN